MSGAGKISIRTFWGWVLLNVALWVISLIDGSLHELMLQAVDYAATSGTEVGEDRNSMAWSFVVIMQPTFSQPLVWALCSYTSLLLGVARPRSGGAVVGLRLNFFSVPAQPDVPWHHRLVRLVSRRTWWRRLGGHSCLLGSGVARCCTLTWRSTGARL